MTLETLNKFKVIYEKQKDKKQLDRVNKIISKYYKDDKSKK